MLHIMSAIADDVITPTISSCSFPTAGPASCIELQIFKTVSLSVLVAKQRKSPIECWFASKCTSHMRVTAKPVGMTILYLVFP